MPSKLPQGRITAVQTAIDYCETELSRIDEAIADLNAQADSVAHVLSYAKAEAAWLATMPHPVRNKAA